VVVTALAMTVVCVAAQTTAQPKTQRTDGRAGDNPLQLAPYHATASVADLDRETDWYQRVLGFKLARRIAVSDGFEVRQLAIPGYGIDLAWQKGSSRQHQTTGYFSQGWMHIVFKTPAVEAAYKHLQDLGTDVHAERNPQGVISRLVVHDPEGNEIEIFAQTDH
jgi:catechol 2,3-dioxygenase-like lactoylglutathione lyase family enzyme